MCFNNDSRIFLSNELFYFRVLYSYGNLEYTLLRKYDSMFL